jgi:DNA-binding MarR family transcriptional regulator
VSSLENEIKQTTFADEYHKLSVNVFFTSSWLMDLHRSYMKPFGLTVQQFNILRILRGQKGSPMSVMGLSERMIDRSSNASRLVDKLAARGLVERRTCGNDRRQVDVTLTKAGAELLKEVDLVIPKTKEVIGANISEKEAKMVNDILDKMRKL